MTPSGLLEDRKEEAGRLNGWNAVVESGLYDRRDTLVAVVVAVSVLSVV
jgi:hypothetical protein